MLSFPQIQRASYKQMIPLSLFAFAVALAFLSVVPEVDLLLFLTLTTFFLKNSPEIACQAPKSPKTS
jgi:hypothetical protein